MGSIKQIYNTYSTKQLDIIDLKKVPKHVAIIMDGNRRWAKKHCLPSIVGHTKGAEALTNLVKASLQLGIKTLTVFAFSTENWQRSESEIKNLMNLFDLYLKKQKDFMMEHKVKLDFIGDLSKCPKKTIESFHNVKKLTSKNEKLDLVIAINYGARDEMKRAMIKLIKDYDEKKINLENINEETIRNYLDTSKYKDPDLLIRTSDEKRISNFLLWQMSYTEIYITDTLWPDFNEKQFLNAIYDFQKRKRRHGGT
ncbi:MAG: isoprenyl transferase [Parachlamydiales bacterium]|nr:isoprenyl transferase [Parachlamydiales bacterium]